MKIDRLLAIVTILLQQERVTAPVLADKLEVSRRTIHRDIDDICKAGIPVITNQGANGGISIADGFKLDKNIFTVDEIGNIIIGLKSLESVSDTSQIQGLISKLVPIKKAGMLKEGKIHIDLASHYKESITDKIDIIKKAIIETRFVSFEYYSEKGCSTRNIEPYSIFFKWASWYVLGYCADRKDFRLFKLNRIWNHQIMDEVFTPRDISDEVMNLDNCFSDDKKITLLLDRSVEYRIVEDYGPNCYEVIPDGRLKLTIGYTNREYMISWVLGFGEKIRILEPSEMADEIKERAKKILMCYEQDI